MQKSRSQIYEAMEKQILAAGTTITKVTVVDGVIRNEDGIDMSINNDESHTCKSLVVLAMLIRTSIDSMSNAKLRREIARQPISTLNTPI
jgi:hypothetical protein